MASFEQGLVMFGGAWLILIFTYLLIRLGFKAAFRSFYEEKKRQSDLKKSKEKTDANAS